MEAEPIQLIPRNLTENLKLLTATITFS